MKKMVGGISYKTMRTKQTEDAVETYLNQKRFAEGEDFKKNFTNFITYKSWLLNDQQKRWINAWGVKNKFIQEETDAREAVHERPRSAINFGSIYGDNQSHALPSGALPPGFDADLKTRKKKKKNDKLEKQRKQQAEQEKQQKEKHKDLLEQWDRDIPKMHRRQDEDDNIVIEPDGSIKVMPGETQVDYEKRTRKGKNADLYINAAANVNKPLDDAEERARLFHEKQSKLSRRPPGALDPSLYQ